MGSCILAQDSALVLLQKYWRHGSTATRFYNIAQGRNAHPGLVWSKICTPTGFHNIPSPIVKPRWGMRDKLPNIQGALRDPGLCCETPLAYLSQMCCLGLDGYSDEDPGICVEDPGQRPGYRVAPGISGCRPAAYKSETTFILHHTHSLTTFTSAQ